MGSEQQAAGTSSSELLSELGAGRRDRVRAGVGSGFASLSNGKGQSASRSVCLPCSAMAWSRTASSASLNGSADALPADALSTCQHRARRSAARMRQHSREVFIAHHLCFAHVLQSGSSKGYNSTKQDRQRFMTRQHSHRRLG